MTEAGPQERRTSVAVDVGGIVVGGGARSAGVVTAGSPSGGDLDAIPFRVEHDALVVPVAGPARAVHDDDSVGTQPRRQRTEILLRCPAPLGNLRDACGHGVDVATGFAMDLIEGYDGESLWVPVSYKRVRVFAPLSFSLC